MTQNDLRRYWAGAGRPPLYGLCWDTHNNSKSYAESKKLKWTALAPEKLHLWLLKNHA